MQPRVAGFKTAAIMMSQMHYLDPTERGWLRVVLELSRGAAGPARQTGLLAAGAPYRLLAQGLRQPGSVLQSRPGPSGLEWRDPIKGHHDWTSVRSSSLKTLYDETEEAILTIEELAKSATVLAPPNPSPTVETTEEFLQDLHGLAERLGDDRGSELQNARKALDEIRYGDIPQHIQLLLDRYRSRRDYTGAMLWYGVGEERTEEAERILEAIVYLTPGEWAYRHVLYLEKEIGEERVRIAISRTPANTPALLALQDRRAAAMGRLAEHRRADVLAVFLGTIPWKFDARPGGGVLASPALDAYATARQELDGIQSKIAAARLGLRPPSATPPSGTQPGPTAPGVTRPPKIRIHPVDFEGRKGEDPTSEWVDTRFGEAGPEFVIVLKKEMD